MTTAEPESPTIEVTMLSVLRQPLAEWLAQQGLILIPMIDREPWQLGVVPAAAGDHFTPEAINGGVALAAIYTNIRGALKAGIPPDALTGFVVNVIRQEASVQ